MLTYAQWMVVVIFAILVGLSAYVGGPVPAAILGLPFVGIVAYFYWRQGKRRSS